MNIYKSHIEGVLKSTKNIISKVNNGRYMTNINEPAENITELSQPSTKFLKRDALNSARQRNGIRKLALKLRIRDK